jgi:hypothetical protein
LAVAPGRGWYVNSEKADLSMELELMMENATYQQNRSNISCFEADDDWQGARSGSDMTANQNGGNGERANGRYRVGTIELTFTGSTYNR